MRILFATAELAPLVRVGGLAEASAGLVRALRTAGIEVQVVLPDYGELVLTAETLTEIEADAWSGPMVVRSGDAAGFGPVHLVGGAGLAKPHPYVDSAGVGWPDNDRRFAAFSAAVGRLANRWRPDVVHLNDWHTAFAHAWLAPDLPTVLTIHTLGYQGTCDAGWLGRLPLHAAEYRWYDSVNPLAGSIRLADRVVAVSANYAREILTEEWGMGLHGELAARAGALMGIRNGITVAEWDPALQRDLPATFDRWDLTGKAVLRETVCSEVGLPTDASVAVVGMVTRLVDQKGIDLVIGAIPYLEGIGAQLVILGAGSRELADAVSAAAAAHPRHLAFREGYDLRLGRMIIGGSDLVLMPSRFEPCGLTQMQAMVNGTIPVVTDVGGLHDTVIDADADRRRGTGFVSRSVDLAGVVDALHRARRAWGNRLRRKAIIGRAMAQDLSWNVPAETYRAVYEELTTRS